MESSRVQQLENDVIRLFLEVRNSPPYKVAILADRIGVILEQMETEYELAPSDDRAYLQRKIGVYRDELQRVNSSAELGGMARTILVAEDTENIAGEVGRELQGQREQLLNARDRLDEAHVELSKVSRLVAIIRLRVISNKILLIFLIIIEVAILLAICFIKFVF